MEHLHFDPLAAEFGWAFQEVDGLHGLSALSAGHNLEVVLFSPKHLALGL